MNQSIHIIEHHGMVDAVSVRQQNETNLIPFVSVVMPSFNQAGFIEQAIRSVLEQGYPKLELIVADGGSRDGTLALLERLQAEFTSNLIWHSEPDTGPANAINKALRQAKGDMIGWLNSDDLYTPSSIYRAVSVLQSSPETVMVYGESEHIDEYANVINRYPTKPPAFSLSAFQSGCYLCQPTVFLKRDVLDQVGLLDESIKTAFDFEWWLRIFKAYPGRIAHLGEVQAYSRLHDNCITLRQRRLVALEGMEVLYRHTGSAQPHWLVTYFDELCAYYPHGESPVDLRQHMLETIRCATSYIKPMGMRWLNTQLSGDKRWQLVLPNIFTAVHADGWASRQLTIRLRPDAILPTYLELHCENAQPHTNTLTLSISNNWNATVTKQIYTTRHFVLKLTIPRDIPVSEPCLFIHCDTVFIPKHSEQGSTDTRELAFKVNKTLSIS